MNLEKTYELYEIEIFRIHWVKTNGGVELQMLVERVPGTGPIP